MTDENDEEEFDVGALAALARPSLAPAPEEDDEDEDEEEGDEDDAKVDLRALAASIPPEAPEDDDDEDSDEPESGEAEDDEDDVEEAVAAAPKKTSGAKKKTKKKKSSGAVAAAASSGAEAKAAPVAAQAEPAGGGMMIKAVMLVAALGAGAWVAFGQGSDEPETHAANEPRTERAEVETTLIGTTEPSTAETDIEPAQIEPAQTETETETETETAIEEPGESVTVENTTRMRRVRTTTTAMTETTMEEATMDTVVAMTEPTMEATMEETMAPGDMSSVEDLLSRALGGMEAEPTMVAMEAAMDENLPDVPSRSAVTRALGGLMSRMRQCAGEQEGLATARIRVSNDGQVASANIGGRPFGGTPQGECMERVVKTARFPRFRRTNFDVTYPFSIRQLN